MKLIASLPIFFLAPFFAACSTVEPRPIPKEAIADAVDSRRSEYRGCLEKNFGQTNREGKVRIEFHVSTTGQATNFQVKESTFRHGPFEQCLIGILARTTFPAADPDTHYEVSYPFRFTAKGR